MLTRERSEGPRYRFGDKIRRQIRNRGWGNPDEHDLSALDEVIAKPDRIEETIDWREGRGSPAAGYVRADGHYVIINNDTGEIVQVSDTHNPGLEGAVGTVTARAVQSNGSTVVRA